MAMMGEENLRLLSIPGGMGERHYFFSINKAMVGNNPWRRVLSASSQELHFIKLDLILTTFEV
jgi:hypothetical protein